MFSCDVMAALCLSVFSVSCKGLRSPAGVSKPKNRNVVFRFSTNDVCRWDLSTLLRSEFHWNVNYLPILFSCWRLPELPVIRWGFLLCSWRQQHSAVNKHTIFFSRCNFVSLILFFSWMWRSKSRIISSLFFYAITKTFFHKMKKKKQSKQRQDASVSWETVGFCIKLSHCPLFSGRTVGFMKDTDLTVVC